MPPTSKLKRIRRSLLHWYDHKQRDLPWRRTRNPYAIWIAETMLQQTRVTTVLPYYRSFMKTFPTLRALDRAPKNSVLALWSGLGYYRRAENIKAAARKIRREHGGRIPQDFRTLCTLPGIGAYTAGALLSIAFNRPYPALDGNARRVLGRLFQIKSAGELRRVAGSLMSRSRPGEFNQALMDLGATTCLAGDPNCRICPVTRFCAARRSGDFHRHSSAKARPQVKNVEWPLALIVKNNRILLRRRPEGGLLGGLWEVPGGQKKRGESSEATLARHLNGLAGQLESLSFLDELRHHITDHRIRAPLFIYPDTKKIRLRGPTWRWVPLSSLQRYPLSSLSLKAIRLLRHR
ncbi:MAG: A/G-specific adenine glycosylase [Candidatus Binatia bacterium]